MLEIDLPEGLRTATQRDWRQLGDITAEAFAEDPLNLWIFKSPRAMKPLFRLMAKDVYTQRGLCHLAGDGAAAMWAMPGADIELSSWSLTKLLASQVIRGAMGNMKRAEAAGAAMAAHHPKAPHIYLFTLGTRKAARGTGLGKALLAPVLSAADRAGQPVYLENTNPANTGFYTAHGFERMALFHAVDDAPPMEAMWREAR